MSEGFVQILLGGMGIGITGVGTAFMWLVKHVITTYSVIMGRHFELEARLLKMLGD